MRTEEAVKYRAKKITHSDVHEVFNPKFDQLDTITVYITTSAILVEQPIGQ
jgi:hypothetical protein